MRTFLVLLCITLSSTVLLAQELPPARIDANSAAGIQAGHVYGGIRENVDLATGGLTLTIPLISLPGRAGHDLSISLQYNSKIWNLEYGATDYWNTGTYTFGWAWIPESADLASGWQLTIPRLTYSFAHVAGQTGFGVSCYSSFVLTTGDGARHVFPNRAQCEEDWGTGGVGAYEAAHPNEVIVEPRRTDFETLEGDSGDGAFIRLDTTTMSSVVAYFPDGSRIDFGDARLFDSWMSMVESATAYGGRGPEKIVDRNGNYISFASGTFTDTVGRKVTLGLNMDYSAENPPYQRTVSWVDRSDPAQQKSVVLNFSGPFRQPALYPAPLVQTPVSDNIDRTHGPGSLDQLTSVVLPNGSAYSFQYDDAAELKEIHHPTGGYTRVDYGVFKHFQHYAPTDINQEITDDEGNHLSQADTPADIREVVAVYECAAPLGYNPNQVNLPIDPANCPGGEHVTTYTPTVNETMPNNQFMEVTYPDSTRIKVQFPIKKDLFSGREIARWAYNSDGTLAQQTTTTYTSMDSYSKPHIVVTTNSKQQQSRVETEYYNDTAIPQFQPNQPNTYYYGPVPRNVRQIREYGFSSTDTPVRVTDFSWNDYDGTSNNEFFHIYGLKQSEIVRDSQLSPVVQTTYEYDNNGSSPSSTGAIQHDTSQYQRNAGYTSGKRGNPTAVNRWLGSESSWLRTQYVHDDTGNVTRIVDPAGHRTDRSYSDRWDGNETVPCLRLPGQTAAYATTVTNDRNQSTLYWNNACSGTISKAVDPNNVESNFRYDLMNRPISASTAASSGIQRTFQYQEASLPMQVITTTKINDAVNHTQTQTIDGLGRAYRVTTSDPDGDVTVDTAYDFANRVLTRSNPYRSAGESTSGTTQYRYDALGRTTLAISPDGGTNSITYEQKVASDGSSCNLREDPQHKQVYQCFDSLGRLVRVEEPGPAQSNPSP